MPGWFHSPKREVQSASRCLTVILAQSGTATLLGKEETTALQLSEGAVNKQGGINSHAVHFAFSDDQSNSAVDVELANLIIAKTTPVLLGQSVVARLF